MDKTNKISQTISRIVCIIFIFLGILMLGSFIFNNKRVPGILRYKPIVAKKDITMSNIKKGNLIVIKDIDVNDYEINDIIVYKKNKKNIVSKIEKIENYYNDKEFLLSNSETTYKDNIQGKVIVKIPLLGYLVIFLQSIAGVIITILGIILSYIWYKSKTKEA